MDSNKKHIGHCWSWHAGWRWMENRCYPCRRDYKSKCKGIYTSLLSLFQYLWVNLLLYPHRDFRLLGAAGHIILTPANQSSVWGINRVSYTHPRTRIHDPWIMSPTRYRLCYRGPRSLYLQNRLCNSLIGCARLLHKLDSILTLNILAIQGVMFTIFTYWTWNLQ